MSACMGKGAAEGVQEAGMGSEGGCTFQGGGAEVLEEIFDGRKSLVANALRQRLGRSS